MDRPLTDSDKLPDFPNWELPTKTETPIDPIQTQLDWEADWKARVASGEITLEKLRNRQKPVEVAFEMWY